MPSKIYIKTSKSKIQNIIATFLNRHIGIQKKTIQKTSFKKQTNEQKDNLTDITSCRN